VSKRRRKSKIERLEQRRRRQREKERRRGNRVSRRGARLLYVVYDIDLGPCQAWPCGQACPCSDFALSVRVV